ncbi:hypothetical protein N7516_007359, partial [Penicillium verrucosum]|uniref:uncharacterized protein n=1 Tax=Penicillium verrucosum TaxID=60171 RepID=UPI0025458289
MSDPANYTVGWICALPVEYVAAQEFLDEEHEKPSFVSPNDTNDYTLGKMCEHNVVIAVLPDGEYGTASAANVATNMLNTFYNVRIGLMVGIGGGVPSEKHDVRLGDVVVSAPRGSQGGVFQYDFGKSIQGQEFQYTRFLNQPPTTLRTAITGIQAQYKRKGHKLIEAINLILDTNVRLRSEYERPESSTDRLFQPSVNHESDCDTVSYANNASNLVLRRERSEYEDNPTIHYGLIASANQLMKDALIRDRLAAEKDVLCFEMEAAGLINTFPYLVIRGVCDYSDSHKGKEWQGYAAMVAAAYAKDLLQRIPLNKIEAEERISVILSDVLESTQRQLQQAYDQQEKHYNEQNARTLRLEQQKCHRAFYISNYTEHKDINPMRTEGTCQWALQSTEYIRWQKSCYNDLIWLSADPGCGKSVLAKSIIDNCLLASSPALFIHRPHLLCYALPSYETKEEGLQKDADELWRIFITATSAEASCTTFCIFDALDECCDRDQRWLIQKLKEFHSQSCSTQDTCLKFLVTSRPYNHIQNRFRDITESFPHLHLKGEEENDQIHKEIDLVVKIRVGQLAKTARLSSNTQQRLEQHLLQIEHHTYLWLDLAMDDIEDTFKCSLLPDQESIRLIPASVNTAYKKILRRVPCDQVNTVRNIFQIIIAARRPLTTREMAMALGMARCRESGTAAQAEINPDNMGWKLRLLCGLFIFINNSRIYLIHQTAREFLIAKENTQLERTEWRQCLNLQKAHQMLSKVCVTYLYLDNLQRDNLQLPGDNQARMESNLLLSYSATYWTEHMREAESLAVEILQLAANLCEEKQISLWFCFVEPQFQHRYRVATNKPLPAFWAVRWGLKDVAELIWKDPKLKITDDVVQEAAANEENGMTIMSCLLDQRGDEIKITEDVMKKAAGNERSEFEITKLLLNRRGEEAKITDGVIQKAAANERNGIEILKLLIDRGGKDVMISSRVMESAAANWWGGVNMIKYLLDQKEVGIRGTRITQSVLRAALTNPEGDTIIKLLQPRSYLIKKIMRRNHDDRRS